MTTQSSQCQAHPEQALSSTQSGVKVTDGRPGSQTLTWSLQSVTLEGGYPGLQLHFPGDWQDPPPPVITELFKSLDEQKQPRHTSTSHRSGEKAHQDWKEKVRSTIRKFFTESGTDWVEDNLKDSGQTSENSHPVKHPRVYYMLGRDPPTKDEHAEESVCCKPRSPATSQSTAS